MLLEPVGQVVFMELSKRMRDLKWTVDDQNFHKEETITEADYVLPKQLTERMENPELTKKVATLKYEGTIDQFKNNDTEGITLTFYTKRLKALELDRVIGEMEEFQTKNNANEIQFFINKPFADDDVQFWLNQLFTKLGNKMEEIYGEQIKEIPIVLLPTKLQQLPVTE
ncbi:hypothetical protein [Jeotgalibacillus campisalis]|uniref:Uncharacterized protein n=1 Tax=Jeotgalibacillus campisalis TaxID=220754 RepID=A0A0C2QYQ4_9BACL|nr:hypothetical protein [Jeotgalibacillus campisalis]KIL43170.1 hypothetical protein KR50_35730 [Jeotgalibacillus campisalis]